MISHLCCFGMLWVSMFLLCFSIIPSRPSTDADLGSGLCMRLYDSFHRSLSFPGALIFVDFYSALFKDFRTGMVNRLPM